MGAFTSEVHRLSPSASPLYPVVAGRLTAINGKPARANLEDDSQGERATRRDLNLTWSETLPPDNQLVAGSWWSSDQGDGVSVEENLAASLRLEIGDRITFDIGGATYEVPVTSIRTVEWNNFQPNFFMIFKPGTLQDVPVTYMTSFYLASSDESGALALVKQFPTVSILPVEALLDQLREILAQVTLAIEFVLLFVLAAGLSVLFAALQATIDERLHQDALLRALGARKQLLITARRSEFLVVGAISGLLAALGCELATYFLYRHTFGLEWSPHPWLWLLPIVSALIIGGAGLIGTRKALTTSPLTVLRET